MNKTLLGSALLLASCFALHAPAFAAPQNALPAEARAHLPKNATSFLWKRLPIGPNGTTMLVHVWGATRLHTPYHIDVFAPVLNVRKQRGWRILTSAAYTDSNEPGLLEMHWLQPAKKQGPVLHIISGSGVSGISTSHKLFVWPQGFQKSKSPTPQEYGSGGNGAGHLYQKFDGVDERGFMTLTSQNDYGQAMESTVSRWNGEAFVSGLTTKHIEKELPIGPGGSRMRVHIWGPMPSVHNSATTGTALPFHINVSAPQLNAKKQWGWHIVSSGTYKDSGDPRSIYTHWLQPAKKQGPVLDIVSGDGATDELYSHKLFVWPRGFQEGSTSPSPQVFMEGGKKASYISQKFDGVDERGFMTIVKGNHRGEAPDTQPTTAYRWDGARFTPIPAPKSN